MVVSLLDYLFSKFPFLVFWNRLALCKTRYFGPSFDQSYSHEVQFLGHHSKQSTPRAQMGPEKSQNERVGFKRIKNMSRMRGTSCLAPDDYSDLEF